jgi:hypothetical protein
MALVLLIVLCVYVAILVLVVAVCRAAAVGDAHVARERRTLRRVVRRRPIRRRTRGEPHEETRRSERTRAS